MSNRPPCTRCGNELSIYERTHQCYKCQRALKHELMNELGVSVGAANGMAYSGKIKTDWSEAMTIDWVGTRCLGKIRLAEIRTAIAAYKAGAPLDAQAVKAAIHEPPMSLRDWFAGQAMSGELAAQTEEYGIYYTDRAYKLAEKCYVLADAMMAERSKERKP